MVPDNIKVEDKYVKVWDHLGCEALNIKKLVDAFNCNITLFEDVSMPSIMCDT